MLKDSKKNSNRMNKDRERNEMRKKYILRKLRIKYMCVLLICVSCYTAIKL